MRTWPTTSATLPALAVDDRKNCDGKVPDPGAFTAEADQAMLPASTGAAGASRGRLDNSRSTLALEAIWAVVGEAEPLFRGEAPWALKKTDPAHGHGALRHRRGVRQIAILACSPSCRSARRKLLDLLACAGVDARDFAALGEAGSRRPARRCRAAGVFPRYVEPEAA
jgi:methionyl-tRNA synthetase